MSFTDSHLFFDDIEVGHEWVSPGRTITQTDIVNFAGLSGDFNPIHIDHEFARTTAFRQPIAHGLLVWSISTGLALHSPAMRTLALLSIREWHFRNPVFVGDTIRVRTKLLEKEVRARGKRATMAWQRHIINQEDKIIQEGVALTLVQGKAAIKAGDADSASEE
ncbi:MAG: MaoC/PaaZ C-terminal domain-containing protein [Gemmataceae bacterium]